MWPLVLACEAYITSPADNPATGYLVLTNEDRKFLGETGL
jgi:hypothetical protein